GLVVAVDIAQITAGAHDVVPRAAFTLEQAGEVGQGAAHLRTKVADVQALSILINRSRAGDEQDRKPVEIDPHAARKRAWLGIGVGFVEYTVIGDGALLNGRVGDRIKYFCELDHGR